MPASVVVVGRAQVLGAGQPHGQLGRVVDQDEPIGLSALSGPLEGIRGTAMYLQLPPDCSRIAAAPVHPQRRDRPAYRFVMSSLTTVPELRDLALAKMPAAETGPPGSLLTMRKKDCPVISGDPAPKDAGGCQPAMRLSASNGSVSN